MTTDPPVAEAAERGAAREQALLSRVDVEAAIRQYAAAESKLKLAVRRQYPRLEVSPGYYWDHGIAKFPFDLGFALPFNGNRGEIAEARAARDLAGQRLLALQAEIYGAIESAENREALARAAVHTAMEQNLSAQHQVEQAELGLRSGAEDAAQSITAKISLLRTRLEEVQMREQWQAARNALEDALHMPLSGPELQLARFAQVAQGDGT